jgi:hypothetical protein
MTRGLSLNVSIDANVQRSTASAALMREVIPRRAVMIGLVASTPVREVTE